MTLGIQYELANAEEMSIKTTNPLKNVDLEAVEHDGEKLTKMTSKASVASLLSPDGGYG